MVRPLPAVVGLFALLTLGCSLNGAGDTAKATTDSSPTAYFFWVGAVSVTSNTATSTTTAEEYVDGIFGVGVFGSKENDWVCMDVGTLAQTTPIEEPCDGCTYAYNFVVNSTVPEGTWCDAVGLTAEGDYDGYEVGFGWGAEHYYYTNSYATYTFDDPVYAYYQGEWLLWAYSYNGNAYTYNTPEYMQFMKPFVQYYNGSYSWVYGGYARD